MLLNDTDFSFGIYLKPWNSVGNHSVLVDLLAEVGIYYEEVPNEDIFLLVDNINKEKKELRLFDTMNSEFGEFTMFYNMDGHLELTNSKSDSMIITYSDIAIVVFDNSDLSVIDQSKFVLDNKYLEFMESVE